MFFLVVLAHTDEQYNNLLNKRELIIVINVRLSNRYFKRFQFHHGINKIPSFLEMGQKNIDLLHFPHII